MEEEWVHNIYKKLMNKKSTEERKKLLQGLSEDQNRRLTAFIKKKNKIAVTKKFKVKTELTKKKQSNAISQSYRILVDYTNINYDLSLTNYVGRVLRIHKIKDTPRLTKGLHLYMNILCGIIFKKFAYEHKKKQNNTCLLIFLKQQFPLEFKKYESKYIERWAPNLNASQEHKESNKNQVGKKDEEKKVLYPIQDIHNDVSENVNKIDGIRKVLNKNNQNLSELKEKDKNNNVSVLVKREPVEDGRDKNEKGYENGTINEKFLQNELLYFVKKEVEKEETFNNETDAIKEITAVLFNEKRFDYRIRMRSIMAQHLIDSEYKEFCNLRKKLFKYKKNTFIRWIQTYTKIKHLDLYIVNFFIFLFIDRLNIVVETYVRLNYFKIIVSCESFVKHFRHLLTLNEILDTFCERDTVDTVMSIDCDLEKNSDNSIKSFDVSNWSNCDILTEIKEFQKLKKSNFLKEGNKKNGKNVHFNFNEKYNSIIEENEQNFFLSLQLIYNLDIYYFKVQNKITFDKLIDINMATYINESNVYELINFKKGKDEDPWKKFVHFVTQQNRNMKLQKFDYFTVFFIARFKFYLEEFKENANIDYIYKIIKEEFDEVENFVTCKTDDPDFEFSHLIPLYVNIKREVKQAQDYIKFYGNMMSCVNFVEKFIGPHNRSYMIKREKEEKASEIDEVKTFEEDKSMREENCKYFDLSFFLSPVKPRVKKE